MFASLNVFTFEDVFLSAAVAFRKERLRGGKIKGERRSRK